MTDTVLEDAKKFITNEKAQLTPDGQELKEETIAMLIASST